MQHPKMSMEHLNEPKEIAPFQQYVDAFFRLSPLFLVCVDTVRNAMLKEEIFKSSAGKLTTTIRL